MDASRNRWLCWILLGLLPALHAGCTPYRYNVDRNLLIQENLQLENALFATRDRLKYCLREKESLRRQLDECREGEPEAAASGSGEAVPETAPGVPTVDLPEAPLDSFEEIPEMFNGQPEEAIPPVPPEDPGDRQPPFAPQEDGFPEAPETTRPENRQPRLMVPGGPDEGSPRDARQQHPRWTPQRQMVRRRGRNVSAADPMPSPHASSTVSSVRQVSGATPPEENSEVVSAEWKPKRPHSAKSSSTERPEKQEAAAGKVDWSPER